MLGEISTGAANDLEKVSHIVKNMLTVYGMSKHMPNLSLVEKGQNNFLGEGPTMQRRSEKLEELIDQETQEIIDACYRDARQVLVNHRKELTKMARLLLEKEKIDAQDIQNILGEIARTADPVNHSETIPDTVFPDIRGKVNARTELDNSR